MSPRILHLVPGGLGAAPHAPRDADDDLARAAALLRDRAPGPHTVCFLGPAHARRRAATLGLRIDAAIAPPLGRPALAARALRALVRRLGPFDLVQAWSAPALALARRGFGPASARSVPLVWASLAGEHERVLRAWSRFSSAGTESPADAVLACAESSWRPRVIGAPAPVPAHHPDPARRASLRDELRLEDADRAVLLLGDAPHASAARFAFALGLARYAGCQVVGIVRPSAADLPRARRLQRQLSREVRLVSSTRPRHELLAAADLAAWDGGGPGPALVAPEDPLPAILPVSAALAAGVPAVAPAWDPLAALYPAPARTECLGFAATSAELARKLIPLIEDPARARALGDACREHLRAQHPQARFIAQAARAWSFAAGPRAAPGALSA